MAMAESLADERIDSFLIFANLAGTASSVGDNGRGRRNCWYSDATRIDRLLYIGFHCQLLFAQNLLERVPVYEFYKV